MDGAVEGIKTIDSLTLRNQSTSNTKVTNEDHIQQPSSGKFVPSKTDLKNFDDEILSRQEKIPHVEQPACNILDAFKNAALNKFDKTDDDFQFKTPQVDITSKTGDDTLKSTFNSKLPLRVAPTTSKLPVKVDKIPKTTSNIPQLSKIRCRSASKYSPRTLDSESAGETSDTNSTLSTFDSTRTKTLSKLKPPMRSLTAGVRNKDTTSGVKQENVVNRSGKDYGRGGARNNKNLAGRGVMEYFSNLTFLIDQIFCYWQLQESFVELRNFKQILLALNKLLRNHQILTVG